MSDVPNNLKYTKTHEWVKVVGSTAVVGITDFAQEELHEVVFAELPELGRQVQKGTEFAAVESVKARSEIFAPVSGKIVKINQSLVEGTVPAKPELINEQPYGTGWLAEIQLTNPAEVNDLLSADDYKKILETAKH